MNQPNIYADALDCQNACNGVAIMHTLAKHLSEVTGSTDERNKHPAVQLFLSKLVSLAGGDYAPPSEAWQICEDRRLPQPTDFQDGPAG